MVLERDQSRCRVCRVSLRCRAWECHHANYSFLFREKQALHLCWAVCPDCHDVLHGRASPSWEALEQKFKKL